METAADLTINKLRISNAVGDATTLRLRLHRWMGTLEIKPPGIPPAAVLIVRRLPDPLPRGLDPAHSVMGGHGAWERAVRARLSELYRGAARPLQGPVPANAEAVLFQDAAEMLACLAQDVIESRARERWWWQGFFRHARFGAQAMLAQALFERPELLPNLLQRLAERGLAEGVLDSLDMGQVRGLLQALCRVFALPTLPASLFSFWSPVLLPATDSDTVSTAGQPYRMDGPQSGPNAGMDAVPVAVFGTGSGFFRGGARLPPVERIPPGFAPEKACLLALGLALYHAPSWVRSAQFPAQLSAWLAAVRASAAPHFGTQIVNEKTAKPLEPKTDLGQSAIGVAPPPTLPMPERKAPLALTEVAPKPLPAAATEQASGLLSDVAEPERSAEASMPAAARAEARVSGDGLRAWPAKELPTPPAAASIKATHRQPPPPLQVVDQAPAAAPPRPPVAEVEQEFTEPSPTRAPTGANMARDGGFLGLEAGHATRWGGAFYLINLMISLDLPGCFEDDWRLASGLGPWGVLDLLCRALVDDRARSAMDDPLWAVLAALDRRDPAVPPGAALCDPGGFRLPPAWPLFGAADLVWAAAEERCWLWAEQGPLLAEMGLDGTSARSLAQALADTYAPGAAVHHGSPDEVPLAVLRGPLSAGLTATPRRWLERTLPYLYFRLRRGLGCGAAGGDLTGMLLSYSARVYISSAHLDVVMSLKDASVALRIAGLDRNPGWLPEFGRVVLFHFE